MRLSVFILAAVAAVLPAACVGQSWERTPLNDGAKCDVDEVHTANRALSPLLDELVNTTFFRLFRLGIDGQCPLTLDSEAAGEGEHCQAVLDPDGPVRVRRVCARGLTRATCRPSAR
jgi:hypothetical protein